MAKAKVESTKLEAYYLEDVLDAISRNDPNSTKFDGIERINWTVRGEQGSEWGYVWITKYKVLGKRILAVLADYIHDELCRRHMQHERYQT